MTARSSFIDGDPDSDLERRDAVRSLNGPPPLALAARGSSLSEVWPSLRLKTQMVPQDPGRRSGGRASHGATRKRTVTGHFQLNLRLSATASAARPRPGSPAAGPNRNRPRFGQARPRRLFAACRSARLQHGPAPLPRVPTFAASTFRAAPLPQRRDRPGGPPCSASARMCAAGDPPLKGRTSTGSRSAVHYVFLLHQEEAERPQHASNPPAPVYATLIRIRPAEAVPRPAPARRAVASSRRPLY